MTDDAPSLGRLIALAVGWIGTIGCWLWCYGVIASTSFGAPLRQEWQNWLGIILYGAAPAILSTTVMVRAGKSNAPLATASSSLLAFIPFLSLGFGVFALQAELWPI